MELRIRNNIFCVILYHLVSFSSGNFDGNFTLQSVYGRLQSGSRSSIQCTSSSETQNKIKIHRFQTGQGTRLPKQSVQYLQPYTRIFQTKAEDGLLRFGAYQCKMTLKDKVTSKDAITEIVTLKLPPFTQTEVDATEPYQVANVGDDVTLNVVVLKEQNLSIEWMLNNKDLGQNWINQTEMKLKNIKKGNAGIYEAFYTGRRAEGAHALMRLIVRNCPSDMYGTNCDETCPTCYNGGICHDKYGVCICPAGFTGTNCQIACGGNRFGGDCNKYCVPPVNTTNAEDGCASFTFCKPDPYGCSCAPGFKGNTCVDHCEPGWYGADCKVLCHCAYGPNDCNRITGACSGGCASGWHGGSCEVYDPDATGLPIEITTLASCEVGKYDSKCEKSCHCANGVPCDVVTGQCPSGCDVGWGGSSCSVCDKGRFGDNCESFCHCYGGYSNCNVEGFCITGCDAGWTGFTCQQGCADKRFGQNCASTCHCYLDTDICDKVTGNCSGDCQPGYMGVNCQTICPLNTFGTNCKSTCCCVNGGQCNRIDGTCVCEGRWRGLMCNESEPQIIAATDEETNIGQTAFISCTADAVPPPEMNLASIEFPGHPFILRALDKNQFQAIIKILPEKSGEFEFFCSAKNLHGFDRKAIIFSAFDPPKFIDPPQVMKKTKSSISISWKAWTFGHDFGGKATDKIDYMVVYRESGKLDWLLYENWKSDLDSTLLNLNSYTEYEIAVKCRRPNKGGEGEIGPHINAQTECGDPLLNAIPHHFLPDEMSASFVRLTWKNPLESQLKCKLIGYNLMYYPDDDINNTGVDSLTFNEVINEVELYDIPTNRLYKYRLYPITLNGPSKFYAELSFRTTDLVPGPVTDLEYELSDEPDVILLKWKKPTVLNGLIKAYNVTYELIDHGHCGKISTDKDSNRMMIHTLVNDAKIRLIDLSPYSTYVVTVAAQTASGEGDSISIEVSTTAAAPDTAPTNVQCIEKDSTILNFEWDAIPCETSNGQIVDYEYNLASPILEESVDLTMYGKVKRGADIDLNSSFKKVKGLFVLIEDLVPYTEYSFGVRGCTKVDCGPFSEFVMVKTLEGVPSAPRRFMIDSVSSTDIVTSWFKPVPTNGDLISYRIHYWVSPNSTDYKEIIYNVTSDNNKQRHVGNVTNLLGATQYVLKIQASTNEGYGAWSQELRSKTLEGVSGPPQNFTLIGNTETALKVSWKDPLKANGKISGFKISYHLTAAISSDNEFDTTLKESLVNSNASTFVIESLYPNSQYVIYVEAKTSAGYGLNASIVCWTKISDNLLPSIEVLDLEATNDTIPILFSTVGKSNVYKYQVIVEADWNTEPINEELLSGFKDAVTDQKLPYYIAAELDPANMDENKQQKFIVGDRKIWGTYENVNLNPGHKYRIRIRTLFKNSNGVKSLLSDVRKQAAKTTGFPVKRTVIPQIFGFELIPFILIVISVIVFLFIIVFFIILAVCRRKEKRATSVYCNRNSGVSDSLTWSVTFKTSENEALVSDGWKYSTGIDKSTLKKSKIYAKNCQGISIERLPDYVTNMMSASNLAEEFKQLVSGQTAPWTIARKSENLKRNRYGNILPYDRFRVVLHPDQHNSDTDYINASYIDGYGRKQEYIITQGPLDYTVVDFWRMVWQENSPVIIMLTDQIENGKIKCSKYWTDDSMKIGHVNVLNIFTEEFADFTIRTLLMTKTDEGRTHRVMQYQFTGWPDRTVPLNSYFLLKMIKRVRSDNPVLGGPMIVHCSAGAGRSGTYVALDTLIQQAQEEKCVDIFRFVNSARLQRINLVQTMEQYLFIHEALLDAILSEESQICQDNIAYHINEFRKSSTLDRRSIIRKQFEMLKQSQKRFDVSLCSVALSESNVFKNRDPMTVPTDISRICLREDEDWAGVFEDYINAIYVDAYGKKDYYIVTQMPLTHTVEDFWRLIFQSKVSMIVMMNNINDDDDNDANIGQYWSSDMTYATFGNFAVQTISVEEEEDITIQTLRLIKDFASSQKDYHDVIQLQYKAWCSGQQVPADTFSMLNLLSSVESRYKTSDGGPIVLHCMDGTTRCGIFCTCSYICNQIKNEKVMDAYQAVKNVRMNRREFILSLEQFVFCFEVANELSRMSSSQPTDAKNKITYC